MSTPQQELERTLKDLGGINLDLSERAVGGDTTQTVRFCFNPWMELSNLDGSGTKFNIPYARIERFRPILLPAFPAPKISPRKAPMGFIGNLVTGDAGDENNLIGMAVASGGVGSHVETVVQMPSTSVEYLLTAWKRYGMVELKSLKSDGARELKERVLVFRGVFESGEMPAVSMILEAWPGWLADDAPGVLDRLFSKGVKLDGDNLRLPEKLLGVAEQMVTEVSASVARAHEAALSESSGILPNTKALYESKQKLTFDKQDRWLLQQFPSFEMDTEIERAQKANEQAMQESAKAGGQTASAMLELAQQNAAILKELAESRKENAATMAAMMEFFKSQRAGA